MTPKESNFIFTVTSDKSKIGYCLCDPTSRLKLVTHLGLTQSNISVTLTSKDLLTDRQVEEIDSKGFIVIKEVS